MLLPQKPDESSLSFCPDFPAKCVFVVPTYELKEEEDDNGERTVPADKSELMRLVGQNKARPFHDALFKPNQQATNFNQ